MSNLKSAHSSNKIITKLNKLIEDENYYEANQLYGTIFFRFINAKRYDELESLLIKGCFLFLEKKLWNSAAELVNYYINCLKSNADIITVMKDERKRNDFVTNIVKIFELLPQNTPQRTSLVSEFSKLNKNIFPIGNIHNLIGKVLWKENNYIDARTHFLRSSKANDPAVGEMLVHFQISSNAEDEIDLLLTQFVLQVLCMNEKVERPLINSSKTINKEIDFSNLYKRSDEHQFAITAFQTYILNHPKIKTKNPPYQTPLLNFLAFLLLAIENGNGDSFKTLVVCYSKELKKDENFENYLSKIGKIYFNIAPKPKVGGLLENILQRFLQDPDEEMNDNEETNRSGTTPSLSSFLGDARTNIVKSNIETSSSINNRDDDLD